MPHTAEYGDLEVSVGSVLGIKCLPFVQELGKVPFCAFRVLVMRHQKPWEHEKRYCQVLHQVRELYPVWLGTVGPEL